MSTDQILLDTVGRIARDHCDKALLDAAEAGVFPQALWSALVATGFHELGLPASGVDDGNLFAVIRECGRYAFPLPVAETMLGKRWLHAAGIETQDQIIGVGLLAGDELIQVPWGRSAVLLLGIQPAADGLYQDGALVVCTAGEDVVQGGNIAGEPCDAVTKVALGDQVPVAQAYAQLALARTVQMAGALDATLELTLQYVNEREQFGRALSKFQAIQHNMAVLAAEVAAAGRASDAAVAALGTERFIPDLAAAKSRVGEAAGIVAEIAHQAHGAMGFTYEHQLHHFTRRLWAWRDDFGNEQTWNAALGAHLIDGGADNVWSFIATRG